MDVQKGIFVIAQTVIVAGNASGMMPPGFEKYLYGFYEIIDPEVLTTKSNQDE